MSEQALLCHPVDIVRKFDPQITESDLSNDDVIGNQDSEQLRARIDEVASKFTIQTGHPMRLGRMGSPNAPETYEYQDVSGNHRRTAPLRAELDYRPVLPLDSSEGDTLEIRTGRDTWEDVTSQAGDEFTLDHRSGRLKLYRWIVERVLWEVPDDRFLRATYRYGALGGSQFEGGQTTLDGSITSSDTSVTVANAARLPSHGTLLLGNDEYARLSNVDHSTDTLTLTRGVNATSASSHSDGAIVHYCPASVRSAVAAQSARELVLYDDYAAILPESGDGLNATEKLDDWESAWEGELAKHSEVRRM